MQPQWLKWYNVLQSSTIAQAKQIRIVVCFCFLLPSSQMALNYTDENTFSNKFSFFFFHVLFFSFLSFLYEVASAPSHTSAEARLTGWPNARPQGRDKCSVVRHHQACLTVCVWSVDAVRPLSYETVGIRWFTPRDLKTHLFEWHCVLFSALAVFSRNALYKSTFYLLTYYTD